MAHTTGILFLQLGSLVHPTLISKIISTAVQKVEKTLYIQVKGLPSETKVSAYNKIVNHIYKISSRNSTDRFDTRVILTDLKDSVACSKSISASKLHTSQLIDTVICVNNQDCTSFLEQIDTKKDTLSQVLLPTANCAEDTVNSGLFELAEEKKIENTPHIAPEDQVYDHVVLGGTFDQLHNGHKMLLSAAVLRCRKSLTIGVTDGAMIQTKKLWELIEPCQQRIENLKKFLNDIEPRLDYNVVPITDAFGPTAHVSNLEVISYCYLIFNLH